jgi:Domain of unknown function (DUF5664)
MSEAKLPTDPAARKNIPLFRGLFKYFPDALCEVAELSRIGNEQHNPGQEMHWAKGKSTDHGDCLLRHQIDVGTFDTDGVRHATKIAWRALAQLQIELDNARKPLTGVFAAPIKFIDAEDRSGS